MSHDTESFGGVAQIQLNGVVSARAFLRGLAFLLILAGSFKSFTEVEHPSVINPKPDAVEYLASAQALAHDGLYYLQVGENKVPPRYSPGMPFLLSVGLMVGVEASQAWMITSLFGALFVALMALAAGGVVRRLNPTLGVIPEVVAMAITGYILGHAPMIKDSAMKVTSDLPGAALGLSALILGVSSLNCEGMIRWLGALISGFLLVMTAAVRPLEGVLFAILLGMVLLGLWWKGHRRRSLQWSLWAIVGGLPLVGLVSGILSRSGWGPWPWTRYEYWIPQKYSEVSATFNWKFLVEPIRTFPAIEILGWTEPVQLSNLQAMAMMVAGLFPVSLKSWCFGLFWPLLLFVGALCCLGRFFRRGDRTSRTLGWIVLLWLLLRVVAYGTYFFPAGRFHLLLLSTLLVLGLGYFVVIIHEGGWPRRIGGTLSILAALYGTMIVMEEADYSRPKDRHTLHLRAHEKWLAVHATTARSQPVPFDPVIVQAFGFMDSETVDSMRGRKLPRTVHTFRLMVAHPGILHPNEVTARSAEWEARRFLVEQRLREPRSRGTTEP